MQTVVQETPTLMSLLGTPQTAQPVAVIDERTMKRDVQRSYDIAVDLDRRFDLVFTGKGKHVDNLESVKLAKRVRVGDGSTAALTSNFALRAVFVAAPASLALVTGFGAAAASDLAILLAGLVPLAWLPGAAVRSLSAGRAAAVDTAKAAPLRASEDDIAALEGFVAKVTRGASPLTLAFAHQIIAAWIDKGTSENVLTLTGVNRLVALLDGIAKPSADDAAAAKRLLETHRLISAIEARRAPTKHDIASLAGALGTLNVLEREAMARRWHAAFAYDPYSESQVLADLRALLPDAKASDSATVSPIPVVFDRAKSAS